MSSLENPQIKKDLNELKNYLHNQEQSGKLDHNRFSNVIFQLETITYSALKLSETLSRALNK